VSTTKIDFLVGE